MRPGVAQPTGPFDVFPFTGGASGAATATVFYTAFNG